MPRHALLAAIFALVAYPLLRAAETPEAPIGHLATLSPDDPERMEMVRVQIFLDRANFRPGKIDGLGGEFTQKAADRYCMAYSLQPGARLDTASIPQPYRTYTVTQDDLTWIGPTATKPQDQAKLKRLPYADTWEELAEKFHCDLNFIQILNPSFKEPPKVGDVIRVPDVEPFNVQAVVDLARQRRMQKRSSASAAASPTATGSPLASGSSASADATATPTATPSPEPKRRLVLLRAPRIIELYENDKLAGCFPCTPGSKQFPVPPGKYRILSNTLMPEFRWDKSVLETGKRSDTAYELPPGPNNPVGIVWLALNIPSRGMHGTPNPDQIGRNESHGCIRLANWDAWVLAQRIKAGTPVEVQ